MDRFPPRYNPPARLLHWAGAALLPAAFLLGLSMEAVPRGAGREAMKAAHYSLGLLVLGLSLARLVWRQLAPPPAPLPGPAWQQRAARLAYLGLHLGMLGLPLAGLLDRWARGRPVAAFGLPLPAPFPIPGGRFWGEAHETLAWLLAALVAMHLAAVAWHVLVRRDGTPRRMLA